ncbi:MAG: sugar ABC transporter substrate-binding protein, partial [Agathobaculum sp.]|uniref:sugar ABC transporter substrate-binding protein n=1 Tax=Agathobaculum sp. TaxID=2048138 RepID=UPI003D8A1F7E
TGEAQMQAVVDALGGSGKIAYLAGTEGTLVASEREEGSMSVLENNPNCELVAREDGDWLREDAISIVETWITSGVEFDAICAACDEMAIGAILALQDAGITDTVVAGIDGLLMGCEYVQRGEMTLTFYADAKGLAYESLDAALALAKGEQPEDVSLKDLLVNSDNVDEYIALWS